MTVLKHEKSGLIVDVSGDVLKLYTKHGWNAVEESEATDPNADAKAAADAQAKVEAEAEARAKSGADAKSEAGDADGSDAGEGETSARQTTKRGTNPKG